MKQIIIFFCLVVFLNAACSNTKKTSLRPTANKNSIIDACSDPSKKYHHVTTIKSRTSYLEKSYDYQPVIDPKGFIAWDFTKDNRLDYIFIEKQQKRNETQDDNGLKIRLVICKSHTNHKDFVRYQRMLPNFSLYQSILPDFQVESHRISTKKEKLILRRNYHEHNWGSDETINTYQYDTLRKDFILVEQELTSSSGDGYRNDTHESYDFNDGQYITTRKCGAFVGPCKPNNSSGSFYAKSISLSSSVNIFQLQVVSKDHY